MPGGDEEQLEQPDLHLVPVAEESALDARAVHVEAVERGEVGKNEPAVDPLYRGMAAGHGLVTQGDLTAGAPDFHPVGTESVDGAFRRPPDDDEGSLALAEAQICWQVLLDAVRVEAVATAHDDRRDNVGARLLAAGSARLFAHVRNVTRHLVVVVRDSAETADMRAELDEMVELHRRARQDHRQRAEPGRHRRGREPKPRARIQELVDAL